MALFPSRQIALQLGPLAIHWYGIMYLLAFLAAWRLLPVLARKRGVTLTKEQTGNLLSAGILGTLIGGRLGYVIFYGAEFYGEHPWEILAVWKGGMSSHGGFIGVTLALWFALRQMRHARWHLADAVAVLAAVGLAIGRLGNFINQELYGTVTDLPWGWAIPGVVGLRHPTPIYAMGKNLLIAGICYRHFLKSSRPGTTLGLFLVLYGVLRFIVEYVRVETAEGFDIIALHLTQGQMLTVPIVVIGMWVFWERRRG